jgi:branched-chain amino acid transport system permease protein
MKLPFPGVLIALIAAAVLPATIGSVILSDKNALLGSAACAFAIAAISLNILMGYAGQISLGQFAFVGVGAFTTGIVTGVDQLRLPWLAGLVAAAVAGGLIAFLVGLPALRLRGLYLAVVTVSVAYVGWQSLFRVEQIGGGSAGKVTPRPYIGETAIASDAGFLSIAAVLLVLVWQLDVNLTRSRLGRAFQAVKADEAVAASFGVDVARYKLIAFTLSGAVAGIAGAIIGTAYGTVTASTFDYARSLLLVVIVVIGGLGSRWGVVTAAIFATLLPDLLVAIFGSGIRGLDLVINAALLMYTLAMHPGGFAGAVRRRARRRPASGAASHRCRRPGRRCRRWCARPACRRSRRRGPEPRSCRPPGSPSDSVA